MKSIPVLMYHHIPSNKEITALGFAKQLEYLKKAGYHTLRLDEFYGFLTGRNPIAKKSVLLTFDDGYADNWIYAYPVLKEYGFNAVVFITTALIEDSQKPRELIGTCGQSLKVTKNSPNLESFLSWKELEIMVSNGTFEVGSHTHTHRNFDRNKSYDNLYNELEISKNLIKQKLGINCSSICWPWGDYKLAYIETAKKLDYKMCFTTKKGANTTNTSPFEVYRFRVTSQNFFWLKSHLAIYGNSFLSCVYSKFYRIDTKIKNTLCRSR